MIILGVHGGFRLNQHDPGAALFIDGQLIACIEEERLTRIKTPKGVFPIEAIYSVLKIAGITLNDVDYIAYPGETYLDYEERLSLTLLHHFGCVPKFKAINHQFAHLASAYFHSGMSDAMCISYDAQGDSLSAALAVGKGQDLTVLDTLDWSNSLGHFYATMTSFLGFQPAEDEYKVMGLAPYGVGEVDLSFFARPTPDGYEVDNSYFRKVLTVFEPYYTEKLIEKLGPPRRKGEPITDWHRNVAFSSQKTLEACIVSLVTNFYHKTGERNLCLAGGVALNCSCNGILMNLPFIESVFVQPAASDRGLALGAGLAACRQEGIEIQSIPHVFFGPIHSVDTMREALSLTGVSFEVTDDPAGTAGNLVGDGAIVGWFQGRSEFGPRALGHRSILADPSRASMKNEINARVKFREEFRPFAPSVAEEQAHDIFEMKGTLPYMTVAVNTKEQWKKKLPATTHVNGTSRVQTVSAKTDPLYHDLIKTVEKKTGCPVVLNTSFNVRGQPIVERPIEAISTFFGTGLDALVMGPFVIRKDASFRTL